MIQQLLEGWVDPDEIDSIFEWHTTPGVDTPFLYLAGDVYKEKIPGTVFISICIESEDDAAEGVNKKKKDTYGTSPWLILTPLKNHHT